MYLCTGSDDMFVPAYCTMRAFLGVVDATKRKSGVCRKFLSGDRKSPDSGSERRDLSGSDAIARLLSLYSLELANSNSPAYCADPACMHSAAVYLITSPAIGPKSGQNLKIAFMVTTASLRVRYAICWHFERLKVACAQGSRLQDLDAGLQLLILLR